VRASVLRGLAFAALWCAGPAFADGKADAAQRDLQQLRARIQALAE
jgi:hypothetical protein